MMLKKLMGLILAMCLILSCGIASFAVAEEEDIVEINVFAPLFSDPPDMNNEFWTEYQRMTHSKLNVEWVDSGSFHTVMHLKIAAADLPEVSGIPDIRTLTLIDALKNGAFWDLTDYLGDFSEYTNLRDNVVQNGYAYLSLGGRIYALPRSRTAIDNGVAIRKDWLDMLGIPLPTTVEEYADALEAIIHADIDGNGMDDTIGISTNGQLPNGLNAAFGALNGDLNEDGTQYPPYLTDGYIDYVAYAADLYARGILDKEYMSVSYDDAFNLFSTGRAASYSNSIWHHYEWEQGCAQAQSDPAPEIVALDLTGPGGHSVQLNTGVSGGYYIAASVPEEKMIRILRYMDEAASQEVTDLCYYGIEGVHHEVVDGVPVLNDLGIAQINVSSKCVGPMAYMPYGKVDSAGASKEYNERKREMVANYMDVGKVDYWSSGVLVSETWSEQWPKFEAEYKANEAKCVSGQMSIDDFRAYVQTLRDNESLKPAFQEFADAYADLMSTINS